MDINSDYVSCPFGINAFSVIIRVKQDSKLHMFEVSGDSLKETGTVDCKGQVFACAFSPDSSLIATGDSGRNVLVYSVPALEVKTMELTYAIWEFHTTTLQIH